MDYLQNLRMKNINAGYNMRSKHPQVKKRVDQLVDQRVNKYSISKMNKDMEDLKRKIAALETEKNEYKKELANTKVSLKSAMKNVDASIYEIDVLKAELEIKDTILAEKDTILDEKDTILDEKDTILDEKDSENIRLKTKCNRLNNKIIKLKHERNEARALLKKYKKLPPSTKVSANIKKCTKKLVKIKKSISNISKKVVHTVATLNKMTIVQLKVLSEKYDIYIRSRARKDERIRAMLVVLN